VAQISYKIIQIPLVSSAGLNTGSSPPFRVVDSKGTDISTNIYAADITIWNSGNIELGADKIRQPLTISLAGDPKIFDRGINRASDAFLDLNVSAVSPNGAEIRWRYLDPNAGFRVRIIYASNEQQTLSIIGNILGVSEFLDIDKYVRRHWQWSLKIFTMVIIGIIFLILSVVVASRLSEMFGRIGWIYQWQFVVFILTNFL